MNFLLKGVNNERFNFSWRDWLRLYPLTKVTNKHLLPVGRYPMIYYPIYHLTRGGDSGYPGGNRTEHMGKVVQLLGSGRDFGVKFTPEVQDEAGGLPRL